MRPSPWLILLLLIPLAGCPAFQVQAKGIVHPAASLVEPSVLPAPDLDAALADQWRRNAVLGLGGGAAATLLDPALVAARVSHQAAAESLSPAAAMSLLDERWDALFGPVRDRFGIDLDWRFDTQFASSAEILRPDSWHFTLVSSGGDQEAPLESTLLKASKIPRSGFWEGQVRLFFPWRGADGNRLLGGANRWVRLVLTRETGGGTFEWRFRGAYG